jgi:hypothetical protein
MKSRKMKEELAGGTVTEMAHLPPWMLQVGGAVVESFITVTASAYICRRLQTLRLH